MHIYIYIHNYSVYIYIYITRMFGACLPACPKEHRGIELADIGWHYLSNTTCLMQASFVLYELCLLKDHHNSPTYSPLSKKACVRRVALDKWLSLKTAAAFGGARADEQLADIRGALTAEAGGHVARKAHPLLRVDRDGLCRRLDLRARVA